MKLYMLEFDVVGRNPFPFDMLRYDRCFPASSEDANRIGATNDEAYTERMVTLRTWREHKSAEPTADRWKSFGWKVLETRFPV